MEGFSRAGTFSNRVLKAARAVRPSCSDADGWNSWCSCKVTQGWGDGSAAAVNAQENRKAGFPLVSVDCTVIVSLLLQPHTSATLPEATGNPEPITLGHSPGFTWSASPQGCGSYGVSSFHS
ncbi:hypothetical protein AMECASPLE_007914 [Ameca splendens]|uniref:Uncharacterized protein n=1 Tax=Ameca splendens TaxID=208324 RepID=A0ABV0XCW4_9TELE